MENLIRQNLQSNIWKFYFYQILQGMFFAIPVIVLFWQENGLSVTQIMILQSIFAIFMVILEVPTGYFADKLGRKLALIISSVFLTLGAALYSLSYNFWQFVPCEILFAISVSCASGASSAFIYDTLKDLKREDEYKKIWGQAMYYGMIALAASNVIGGFVAKISFRSTLALSIPFFFLTIFLAFSFKEPKKHEIIYEKGYLKEVLGIIKLAIFDNKKLRWIIIYSSVVSALLMAGFWLAPPYFQLTKLDIVYFGIVFASFQLISAFSSKYAHKIEHYLGQNFSLLMLIFLLALGYILMSKILFIFSFAFCFLHQFVRGFSDVVISDYINKVTDSHIRATVLSVQSLIGRTFYAAFIPVIGYISDKYSLLQALMVLGVTSFVCGIIFILIYLRKITN